MGNWVSKEEISNELDLIEINEDIVICKEIPLKVANKMLQTNGQLVVIGFDTMQIPRYKTVFKLE